MTADTIIDYRDDPDPQELSTLDRVLLGSPGPKRKPARHSALWPGVLEAHGPETMAEAGSGRTLPWFAGQRMRGVKAFGERITERDPHSRNPDPRRTN